MQLFDEAMEIRDRLQRVEALRALLNASSDRLSPLCRAVALYELGEAQREGREGKSADSTLTEAIQLLKSLDPHTQPCNVNGERITHRALLVKSYYSRGLVGELLLKNHRYAIENYSAAIALDSTQVRFFGARAICYEQRGMYTEAIADYERAMKLSPQDATLYYNRGNIYFRQQNYTQAITDYKRAIQLDPSDVDNYYNAGVAYERQAQREGRLAIYAKEVTIAKPNQSANNAIEMFSQVVQRQPNHRRAYFLRAKTEMLRGNRARALADYQQAAKLGDSNAKRILANEFGVSIQ